MASTVESIEQSDHVEVREDDLISSPASSSSSSLPSPSSSSPPPPPLITSSDDNHEPSINNSEEKIEEQLPISESQETDIINNNINDVIQDINTPLINSTNMITAEASFTEATPADLPAGATRSSVARILVKPGQIFRVQVDNEVKEVHGKFSCY